ncbi:MAG: branched-chain amino acid aminotransferase [Acidimicrobiia bacterium]|nr:branched-chain amino acid aminotransferase [Acidimicrobiia bacterium]
MTATTDSSFPPPPTAAFGTVFTSTMAHVRYADGAWGDPVLGPVQPFSMHPATHVLHYGSACFEGLKAHRGTDGVVRIFRAASHVARMQGSAEQLCMPAPPTELLMGMLNDVTRACDAEVPAAPGSLYLRPTLLGTEPNVGAAAAPSNSVLLFVLASPVGDYFSGGIRPLTIAIETEQPRTTPQFGMVKSGANYVMALKPTLEAKARVGADQVLFAPGGVVQETGAANFMLIDAERVVTPALTSSFLHGVTRDSLLTLARDLGYRVEERDVTVDEVVDWAQRPDAEAGLAGTAAVLAPIGKFVHKGADVPVGQGGIGEHTMRLRSALTDLHIGAAPDPHGWLTLP